MNLVTLVSPDLLVSDSLALRTLSLDEFISYIATADCVNGYISNDSLQDMLIGFCDFLKVNCCFYLREKLTIKESGLYILIESNNRGEWKASQIISCRFACDIAVYQYLTKPSIN